MKQKIIDNQNVILVIASIVAAALVVPSIIGLFGNQLNAASIIYLIVYGLYVATNAVILYLAFKKKDFSLKLLLIPVILFEGASLIPQIYTLINNNTWSTIFYIALYASVLIVYIVNCVKENCKLKIAFYILLLICAAFNLVGLFGGSTIEFSRLLTNLMICGIFYLITKGENE